jgi:hypothetical protein
LPAGSNARVTGYTPWFAERETGKRPARTQPGIFLHMFNKIDGIVEAARRLRRRSGIGTALWIGRSAYLTARVRLPMFRPTAAAPPRAPSAATDLLNRQY